VREERLGGARQRRRAVGPPGARPSEPGSELALGDAPDSESPPVDDDERLRREVPPHHGA
jgi:hypothetical protein